MRELIAPIVRALVAEAKGEALMISQRNAEAVLGISSRMHLENCRRPDFTPHVVCVGKLRLVDASEYREWLRLIDTQMREAQLVEKKDGASRVLAELGLRELSVTGRKLQAPARDAGLAKS